VVFVNYSREDRTVVLPASRAATMEAYVTSESMDLRRQPLPREGIVVPKRSVLTLLLNATKDRPH
jgi:hypothetical protein